MTKNRCKLKLKDGKYASHLEASMFVEIEHSELSGSMVREFRFHPKRKWRLDFAWPEKKLGVEVHGGIWSGKFGGHTSGKGRARDMEKMNEAVLLGWRVIEIASPHIKSGQAILWIKSLMLLADRNGT